MRVQLCLSLFLSMVACQKEIEEPDEVVTLGSVTSKGAFAVGTFEDAFVDSTGVEIPVQAWYPTQDQEGIAVTYDDIYPGESWEFSQPSCEQIRPVVMFSHGNSGIRWQTAFLMDFLASHGFVVVGMDHVTNTFLDQDYSKFSNHVLQRPRNVRESFDWLVGQSDDAESPLAGCVSEEAGYAVMGHSFGGYTTYVTAGATLSIASLESYCDNGGSAACEILSLWREDHPDSTEIDLGDDRVWAAIGLAPWDAYGILGGGMSVLDVEVLTLTGVEDETTPVAMVDGIVEGMGTHPNAYGKMIDTGHFSFSPIACQAMTGDGCGDAYLDLETVKDLTNQSVTSFLGRALGWQGAAEQFPVESEYLLWESLD